MPHLLVSSFSPPLLPLESNGYKYEFSVSCGDETLVGVRYEQMEFLLKIKKRAKDIYIGFDKITRPSPVGFVKNALEQFASISNASIISSNLAQNRPRQKESSPFLKPIEYFVNEFVATNEVWCEIGFGSGRHLLYQAFENPNIQFIGIEIHKPSIEQILRRIKLLNLSNILIVNYDARLFLELMESNSLGKIFVHFPVPWDKKPHRRVISPSFIIEAQRALKVGGELELRTDSELYFEYSKELFENVNKNCFKTYINRGLEVMSKYEERWRRQNKDIYDLLFRNDKESQKRGWFSDFGFEKVDTEKIVMSFRNESFCDKDFFVHTERIYRGEGNMLIKVSLGDFDKPEQKYIYISGGKARYFFASPVPTSSNHKAHIFLKSVLS